MRPGGKVALLGVAIVEIPAMPAQPSLLEIDGSPYELSAIPISIGGEQSGDLKFGGKFDLRTGGAQGAGSGGLQSKDTNNRLSLAGIPLTPKTLTRV